MHIIHLVALTQDASFKPEFKDFQGPTTITNNVYVLFISVGINNGVNFMRLFETIIPSIID